MKQSATPSDLKKKEKKSKIIHIRFEKKRKLKKKIHIQ